MQKKFNYLYIFIIVIWGAFRPVVLHVDGRGLTVIGLTLLAVVVNIRSNNWRKLVISKPMVFWLLWVCYAIYNATVMRSQTYDYPLSNFIMRMIITPFVLMSVISYEYVRDKQVLKVLLYALGGYCLLGLSSFTLSTEGRSENELGNLLPIALSVGNIVLGYFVIAGKVSNKFWLTILFVSVFIITLCATRKAFIAILICTVVIYVAKYNLFSMRNFILFLLILVPIFIGVNYVLESTYLGSRFFEGVDQSEMWLDKVGVSSNSLFLKLMGDRAAFYVLGFELFLKHPFCGIGLTNYATYTPWDIRLHTEYMVQLAECGIIGTSFFFFFYYSIIRRLFDLYKRINNTSQIKYCIMTIGALLVVLFYSFYIWTYSNVLIFTILGIIIGVINSNQTNENSNS